MQDNTGTELFDARHDSPAAAAAGIMAWRAAFLWFSLDRAAAFDFDADLTHWQQTAEQSSAVLY